MVTEKPIQEHFLRVRNQGVAAVLVSADDYPGVRRVAADLQTDLRPTENFF
jgi:hypothetical protein